jgi:uncharacterized protein YbjT (DUF2867 family)
MALRICVTGASGLAGRAVVRDLISVRRPPAAQFVT